jgi:hypothetical protein
VTEVHASNRDLAMAFQSMIDFLTPRVDSTRICFSACNRVPSEFVSRLAQAVLEDKH